MDPTILHKVSQGLPISGPEFGRLSRDLTNAILALQKEVNEIKVSLSGSRVGQDNKGVASPAPVQPDSVKRGAGSKPSLPSGKDGDPS